MESRSERFHLFDSQFADFLLLCGISLQGLDADEVRIQHQLCPPRLLVQRLDLQTSLTTKMTAGNWHLQSKQAAGDSSRRGQTRLN